jgi:glucosamine-6-phosphate deaminase
MKIYRAKDYKDMSRTAANIISAQIILKPDCVLGLATGSTPIGIYAQLVDWYQKGDLDFTDVKTVNLDEYKGLAKDNTQSYHFYMKDKLFRHINISGDNTNIPDGLAKDDTLECLRYTKKINDLGGIDLQLLGLGHNGHIGFNEPNGAFDLETHCVALAQGTIDANSRFFTHQEDIPKYAYTMGIKTIMQAKKILIVVSGEDKAAIVRKAFYGEVSPFVPVSILQMHRDVILVGDEAALSMI